MHSRRHAVVSRQFYDLFHHQHRATTASHTKRVQRFDREPRLEVRSSHS